MNVLKHFQGELYSELFSLKRFKLDNTTSASDLYLIAKSPHHRLLSIRENISFSSSISFGV